MIIGVGLRFRRFGAEAFRRFGAETFLTVRRRFLGAGFGRVRARCFGRDFLGRSAALRRFPPKPALICFAESLRLTAIFLPLAGF